MFGKNPLSSTVTEVCLLEETSFNVFKTILIPNKKYCSYLLKKKQCSLTFLEDPLIINKYTKIKRTPS